MLRRAFQRTLIRNDGERLLPEGVGQMYPPMSIPRIEADTRSRSVRSASEAKLLRDQGDLDTVLYSSVDQMVGMRLGDEWFDRAALSTEDIIVPVDIYRERQRAWIFLCHRSGLFRLSASCPPAGRAPPLRTCCEIPLRKLYVQYTQYRKQSRFLPIHVVSRSG